MASSAARLSAQWYDAADEVGAPTTAHSALRVVLRWTLSEEADAGIAFQDDQPVVVVIDGSRLICVRPEDPAADSLEAEITLDSISLEAPLRVGLMLTEQTHGNIAFLIRRWMIGEPGGSQFQVDTRSPLRQGQREDRGRQVVEKAVAMLGWQLPQEN